MYNLISKDPIYKTVKPHYMEEIKNIMQSIADALVDYVLSKNTEE